MQLLHFTKLLPLPLPLLLLIIALIFSLVLIFFFREYQSYPEAELANKLKHIRETKGEVR
jgi:hypothetical protein